MTTRGASMDYTVWVLGAGFSRSLDGPLLNDFFSTDLTPRVGRVASSLGDVLTADNLRVLHLGYWGGASMTGDRRPLHRPWRDPEEFLAFLDAAHGDGTTREGDLMRTLGFEPAAVTELRQWARRYIAVATDEFVPADYRIAQRMERWRPYFRWAERLQAGTDVVATFNYDRVVEIASSGRIEPRLPSARPHDKRPWLLKLHGSVTWRLGTNGIIGDHDASGIDLVKAGHEPVIGMPGPSKYEATKKDFITLWADMADCVAVARRVVFVGFRFPPGDAEARARLLEAVSKNKNPKLQVHVVLGPMTNDPQVVRVQKLLERAVAKERGSGDAIQRVHVEPLYAEDFIALDDD